MGDQADFAASRKKSRFDKAMDKEVKFGEETDEEDDEASKKGEFEEERVNFHLDLRTAADAGKSRSAHERCQELLRSSGHHVGNRQELLATTQEVPGGVSITRP